MKTVLVWLAMAAPCWGGAIYQISWAGVITTASVHGIDHTQTPFTVAMEAGTPIFGTLTFDLGLSPAEVVNVSPSSTDFLFESTAVNPVWVGGTFSVVLPVLPADALPIPSTFTVGPQRRPANGVETVPSEAHQTLSFTYCNGTCSSAIGLAQFHDAWRIPGDISVENVQILGLLMASTSGFLPLPPNGLPDFTATNLSSGSIFGATQFTEDISNPTPPLFGIREDYVVGGHFNLTEATGRLLVDAPEPGTWLLALAGLAAIESKRRAFLRR